MKNKYHSLFLLLMLVIPGIGECQSNFDIFVQFGNTSSNSKRYCSYTVIYQNGVEKTLTIDELLEKFKNESTFCKPIKIIRVEPNSPLKKDFFKPQGVSCKDLSDNKPIVLESLYKPITNVQIDSKHVHGFDQFNPTEHDQIVIFELDNDYSRKIVKLKDSIAVHVIKSNTLASNLLVYAAAIPSFAEYRHIKINADDTIIMCSLLYNPAKVEALCSDPWILRGVVLHEFGHLVGLHSINKDDSSFSNELEADIYAGKLLFEFQADTNQALRMLNLVNDSVVNPYYPDKQVRRQYILKGWYHSDSANKAKKKSLYEKNLWLIDGLTRAIDSLSVEYDYKRINSDTLNFQMKKILKQIKSINCHECKMELDNLTALYYFNLGIFTNNKDCMVKAAVYYSDLSKIDPKYFFPCGESYFKAKSYESALESLEKADTTRFNRNRLAYLHWMKGICFLGLPEPNYPKALDQLTLSIQVGDPNPEAYQKRAMVKNTLFPDSILSSLNDYYIAYKLLADSSSKTKVYRTIIELSENAYKQAVSGKALNPEASLVALKYLSLQTYNLKEPDVHSQIADCYQIIYDTAHDSSVLDSTIRYSSIQLSLSPNDNFARLLRGKAYYFKSFNEFGSRWIDPAQNDLDRIPETEKELFAESSYYQIRLLIQLGENHSKYCDIVRLYFGIKGNYWLEKIKPFMCATREKLGDRGCMDNKQKKSLKNSCKP